MTRRTNENLIIESYELNRTRLRSLSARQLADWVESGEFIISGDQYAVLAEELTATHATNVELRHEVSRLRHRLTAEQRRDRREGAVTYQSVRQSLAEMTAEQLLELGLVSQAAANAALRQAMARVQASEAQHVRDVRNYRNSRRGR